MGVVRGMNWRPVFDPSVLRRKLGIIRKDLHCTAIRIGGRSLSRLRFATKSALDEGLEVWFCPQLWGRTAARTVGYLSRAAEVLETIRRDWPNRVVYDVGSEISLFSRGILPAGTFAERIRNPNLASIVQSGAYRASLNNFLGHAVAAVRSRYRGGDHLRLPRLGGRGLDSVRLRRGRPFSVGGNRGPVRRDASPGVRKREARRGYRVRLRYDEGWAVDAGVPGFRRSHTVGVGALPV